MAQQDIYNDVTPLLAWRRPSAPTITALKAALKAYNATSYSDATLNLMSERDLSYAARLHNLSVAGLL